MSEAPPGLLPAEAKGAEGSSVRIGRMLRVGLVSRRRRSSSVRLFAGGRITGHDGSRRSIRDGASGRRGGGTAAHALRVTNDEAKSAIR